VSTYVRTLSCQPRLDRLVGRVEPRVLDVHLAEPALQRLGHEVLICTYHNGSNVEGIPIWRSLDIPWRKRVVVGSSKHKIYLDAVLCLTVMRAMRDFRPDLVHAHLHEGALIGGIAGRLFRRPVIFDYQGSLTAEMLDHGFLQQGSRFERFFGWLERRIDRLPDTIITSSENARCTLEENGHPGRPVGTVFDAVDVHRFDPCAVSHEERANIRSELGIDAERPVVGYLGLLAPYQGSDLLLEVARAVVDRCPKASFLIMGFPGDEAYRARAVSLGLGRHSSFPGRIPYQDAHRYLAIADVAVAPKLSMTEGGFTVGREQIALNAPIKTLGLHNVPVSLHPEVEVPITIPEAIRGATIEVPTLNGTKRIRVPPGTQHGSVQRLRGEGPSKPGGGDRRDIYYRLAIEVPRNLSKGQKEAVEQIVAAGSAATRADLGAFEYPLAKLSFDNLAWFQGVFTLGAWKLLDEHGWDFPLAVRARFTQEAAVARYLNLLGVHSNG
jgi:glycosyltransferase involved in cell wall biosynthesis